MNAVVDLNAAVPLVLLGMNVAAQIALVVLLAWVLGRTVARRDPAIRHGMWMCALFCALASPLAAWIMNSAGITLIAIPCVSAQPAPTGSASALPAEVTVSEPAAPAIAGQPAAKRRSPVLETLARAKFIADDVGRVFSSSKTSVNPSRSPAQAEPRATAPAPLAERPHTDWLGVSAFVAGLVWAAGTLLLLGRLIQGCLAVRRLHRTLSWATPQSFDEIRRDARRVLGVDRLPPIALTRAAAGPLTMGVLRPVIVLPVDLVHRLDQRQLRDVLVHELAHALRRDTLVGVLQRLAAALFWPHPMIYVLNRELAQAREELCDNFVLRQADAPGYAETLVAVAHAFPPSRRPAMVALLEHRGKLERRVGKSIPRRSRRFASAARSMSCT